MFLRRRLNTKENSPIENEQIEEAKDVRSLPQSEIKSKLTTCCNHNGTQITILSVLVVISVCVMLTSINIFELRRIEQNQQIIIREIPQPALVATVSNNSDDHRPVYWVYTMKPETGFLKHVHLVLERLGYRHGTNTSDWDLLWAHDYPFTVMYKQLLHLKEHQRINHFPGTGYITNKLNIALLDLESIPLAFSIPKDKEHLMQYAKNNPTKMFVQKSNAHRGVKIEKIESFNFNATDVFVQEFIGRPFLVDGFKFDIGVYTTITSIDPLRVYIYTGDVLFRYCTKKYYPFDPANTEKYVIEDDYQPTWEVPALKKWYNQFGFSMKDSFDAYVRSIGKDPSQIWVQIEKAIRDVCLRKSLQIKNTITQSFNSQFSNYFEFLRFDFILDEDLKVYIMEVNMSPNLSSAHYPPNQLLYEQVIFNMLGLVGVAPRLHKSSLATRSHKEREMQVSLKNIVVYPEECANKKCDASCLMEGCELCLQCLSSAQIKVLYQSYNEHVNRGEFKRIFPDIQNRNDVDIESSKFSLSNENKFIYKWFLGKCLLNDLWC